MTKAVLKVTNGDNSIVLNKIINSAINPKLKGKDKLDKENYNIHVCENKLI